MLREKVVTIVIGLIVGALIATGYFFGPNLIKNFQSGNSSEQTTVQNPTASKLPIKTPSLEVDSPENNSSTLESTVKVSGSASPNAKLVIFTNIDQKQVTASASGQFDTTVKLEEGENEISITDLANPNEPIIRNVTLEITE